MGKFDALRRILRGIKQAGGPAVPTENSHKQRSVDTALTIEAARLVVTTRLATKTLLMRKLHVAGETAEKLLQRLEHCEVISAVGTGGQHRVLMTSAQLPGVVEEVKRRDAARAARMDPDESDS